MSEETDETASEFGVATVPHQSRGLLVSTIAERWMMISRPIFRSGFIFSPSDEEVDISM